MRSATLARHALPCALALLFAFAHDAAAQKVIATVPVGSAPFGLDVNTATNKIYVANTASQSVSVIDGATNAVTTTVTNLPHEPTDIAVNSATNKIYVPVSFAQGVVVINGATDTASSFIPIGFFAFRVSVNPATNRVYVSTAGQQVVVIDGATDSVLTQIPLPSGGASYASAVDTAMNKIYVCDANNNVVYAINGATNTLTKTIPVGLSPQKIAANPLFGSRVYVANFNSSSVTVINGGPDVVLTTVPVGGQPYGVGVDTLDNKVLVASVSSASTSDPVAVIDGLTNTVQNSFTVGDHPSDVAVNPAARRAYVTNETSNTVSVVALPSDLLISEFRFGNTNTQDEFVELFNATNQPITVSTTDGSAGWSLVSNDAGASTVRFTIPNGTVIPGRGHYLAASGAFIGGYSLTGYAAPDQAIIPADISQGAGISLFRTANPANFNAGTRIDSVGYAGTTNPLFFEGSALAPAGGIGVTATQYSWVRDLSTGAPRDTDNNAADFRLVSTSGAALSGVQSTLGAPGPENLADPVQRNLQLPTTSIDATVSASAAPNRVRDLTPAPNAALGTLSLRRRVTNHRGLPVTRLRLRVVNITGFPVTDPALADVRALTSSDIIVTVNDASQCSPNPCNVTARGTTLEQPPNQPSGGGLNSSLSVPTVTLGTPLAPGASVNIQLLLGIQKNGAFRFFVNVEALP